MRTVFSGVAKVVGRIWRRPLALLSALLLGLLLAITVHSQDQLRVGYAVLTADPGKPAPVATALFSFRIGGNLVSEAGVAAVEPIRKGRIFVDSQVPTGLALANPSDFSLTVSLNLRDANGLLIDQTTISLPAHGHTARFVSELFGDLGADFIGSVTFEVTGPSGVGALTIRQSTNAYFEPLFATLPVADLEQAALAPAGAGPGPVIFPHLGAGSVLSTQLILINPTSGAVSGEIQLRGPGGNPLVLELDGESGASFPYSLPPDGVFQGTLTLSQGILDGYAVVTVQEGSASPVGTAIFQFRNPTSGLLSEAGVAASAPTTRARIFVDTVGTRTGFAIANPNNQGVVIRLDLLDRGGLPLPNVRRFERPLPPNGKLSLFVDELCKPEKEGERNPCGRGLYAGFTGVLEISADTSFVPVTLKLTFNDRSDPILTTLPVADLNRGIESSQLIFPQVGFGSGFSTRLIVIGALEADAESHSGAINLIQSDGTPLEIALPEGTDSQTTFVVAPSGASQVRPGNTARPARIVLDPQDPLQTEIVVNAGKRASLQPLVIDDEGQYRDDFPIDFFSLDGETANIGSEGLIDGKEAGFSTVTIATGDLLEAGTITVVKVSSGKSTTGLSGITNNLSGGIFVTNASRHTVLTARSLTESLELYAGIDQRSGLRNGAKTTSLFNDPRSLAFDQSQGFLYIADRANHVIRRIPLLQQGEVETIAGNGLPGNSDGTGIAVRFRNPSGLALDGRGGLWIADSGNHTIRRFDLLTGAVSTVAGSPGTRGNVDGMGPQARFNNPTGISVRREPLAVQADRELNLLPPPPVEILVADRGNGSVRVVREDGLTTTLIIRGRGGPGPLGVGGTGDDSDFDDPKGVAGDPFGNVYVSEGSGEVVTVLPDGSVVDAAQSGTFDQPSDITVSDGGEVLVADGQSTGRQLVYGKPDIQEISPDLIRVEGGVEISIRGRNMAPDSVVVVGGQLIENLQVINTGEIRFVAPSLPSGLQTLTVQHRGGIDQAALSVRPSSLDEIPPGFITTVAGGGFFTGDGGPATEAYLNLPVATWIDSEGNLLITDEANARIRRVDASTGLITTVAGTGVREFGTPDGNLAIATNLGSLGDVITDAAGNIIFVEHTRIRRVSASTGKLDTIAGIGIQGYSGDGGPATEAQLIASGLCQDQAGNLYFTDPGFPTGAGRVRKIDAATGIITTFAGNGEPASTGDGGPATAAGILSPWDVACGLDGNLYITSYGGFCNDGIDTGTCGRVRVVNLQTGIISSMDTEFGGLESLAVDSLGHLFISNGIRVAQFELATGNRLNELEVPGFPRGLSTDAAGGVYYGLYFRNTVEKIDIGTWEVLHQAGNPDVFNGDGRLATDGVVAGVDHVTLDPSQNIFFTDGDRVRRIDRTTGILSTVVVAVLPKGIVSTDTGDIIVGDQSGVFLLPGGVGPAVSLGGNYDAFDIALDRDGQIIVAEKLNHIVFRLNPEDGTTTLLAGSGTPGAANGVPGYSGDGGPSSAALLNQPAGVAVDGLGNIYIADSVNNRVRRIDAVTGVIETVAGNGEYGQTAGDGGPAIEAAVGCCDIIFDSDGLMYVSSCGLDSFIRRIDANGIIQTVVGRFPGDGIRESSGDSGPALEATFTTFTGGLAFDAQGNLYVADANSRLRAVKGPIP